jgi:lipopolysaccharide transport system ATP-binding protein
MCYNCGQFISTYTAWAPALTHNHNFGIRIPNKCKFLSLNLGMDAEATGIENIYLRGALLGYRHKELATKIDEIVDFAVLGDFVHMPIRTYSNGMQMRLGFSIATIEQPDIVVMDEWLTVGDADFQDKVQRKLNEIVQKSSILVIASHSPDLVNKIGNRFVLMEHGRLKEESSLYRLIRLCHPRSVSTNKVRHSGENP